MNPGRAQWRIFPEHEKYYSILNKYFQSLFARASPALLTGCKSPGSATWPTHGNWFSSRPPVLPWAKINWQVKNTQWARKSHCLRINPPLEQELLRDWVLDCRQMGAQPSCSTQPCPALQTGTREHLFWSFAPENPQLPGRLLWCCSGCLVTTTSSRATQAQVPDSNKPRYKHWSYLQRSKWSLKYHVSFLPTVLQKSKFVFQLYVPCIHCIPT